MKDTNSTSNQPWHEIFAPFAYSGKAVVHRWLISSWCNILFCTEQFQPRKPFSNHCGANMILHQFDPAEWSLSCSWSWISWLCPYDAMQFRKIVISTLQRVLDYEFQDSLCICCFNTIGVTSLLVQCSKVFVFSKEWSTFAPTYGKACNRSITILGILFLTSRDLRNICPK